MDRLTSRGREFAGALAELHAQVAREHPDARVAA
jgi:hypothetical protein